MKRYNNWAREREDYCYYNYDVFLYDSDFLLCVVVRSHIIDLCWKSLAKIRLDLPIVSSHVCTLHSTTPSRLTYVQAQQNAQCSSAYQQATDYIFIAWWLEQCHENYVEHDLILFKDSTTRRRDSTIKMWTHNSFGLETLARSHVAAQLRRQTTTFRIMRRSCKYKRKSFVSLFIAPRW